MIPASASFLGTVQEEGKVMYAVAAVVSATAPLFFLVMFQKDSRNETPNFQKNI